MKRIRSKTATNIWSTGSQSGSLRMMRAVNSRDSGGDTFPTLRSGALPAVAYNVTFCDANGTRKDRPEGGLYVTEADASKTVTAGGANAETVVIDSVAIAENIIGRQDHTGGNGVGAQEELAYTQNATGVMGVATMECVPLDLRNATRDLE